MTDNYKIIKVTMYNAVVIARETFVIFIDLFNAVA